MSSDAGGSRDEQFFALSLDMLCIAGYDGYFKRLNPAWQKTLGFSIEELTARPFIEFVHPDDRVATTAEAQKLTTGVDTISFENRYLSKDGSYKWLLWSATTSPEEQLYYAVARDITERKRAEDALRESEARTRLILDSVHDAYVGMDADGLIIAWNAQAERTFGWPREEAIGRPLADTIIPPHHREAHRRGLSHFLATGEGPALNTRLELTALHRDGREFPVEFTISAVPLDGRYTFSAFLHDITERKRADAVIREAKEAAERASQAKSEFLSRMSHELRTPLNAVIGFSELLLERVVGALTEKQEEYLRDIHTSGVHLLTLINEILDLAKIEAGKMELHLDETDLAALVENALSTLRPLVVQKRLDVSATLDPTAAVIRADKVRLKQILFNLLANASKFTPQEGKIRVEVRRIGDEVELAVVDTGPGIAPDDQAKLFHEFAQLETPQQSGQEGTGLGLALVQRLVGLHGGRVWVESEVGKGSRFVVRLPMGTHPVPGPNGADLVLIVEDDPALRRLFTHYLTEAGYRTDEIAGGSGLMDKVKAVRPSVICLDIRLPGVGDWEIMHRLKEDPATASVPIVVTTVLDDAQTAFTLGAVAFLAKPVGRNDLLEAVASAVRMPSGDTPTVLIVDDDSHVRGIIVPMLEKAGYHTITASDGQEGIHCAREHLPHLIVLDLLMPNVNGFDVVTTLRDDVRTRGIPIIILTAKDLTVEDWAYLNERVQGVQLKGSTPASQLVAEVRRVLKSGGEGGR